MQKYKKHQAIFQAGKENRPNTLFIDILGKERVGVAPTLGMDNIANAAKAAAAAAVVAR